MTRELVLGMLGNAETVLGRSARISDANKREIEEARSLSVDMAEAVAGLLVGRALIGGP